MYKGISWVYVYMSCFVYILCKGIYMVFLGVCIYVYDLFFVSVVYIEEFKLYVGRGFFVYLYFLCVFVYNNCVLYRYIFCGVCIGVCC